MQVSVPCGDVNLLVVIYVSEYKLVQVITSMYVKFLVLDGTLGCMSVSAACGDDDQWW